MTESTRRKIIQSIEECDRFISREERRASDLRPASAAKMLAYYKAHKVKLEGMVA